MPKLKLFERGEKSEKGALAGLNIRKMYSSPPLSPALRASSLYAERNIQPPPLENRPLLQSNSVKKLQTYNIPFEVPYMKVITIITISTSLIILSSSFYSLTHALSNSSPTPLTNIQFLKIYISLFLHALIVIAFSLASYLWRNVLHRSTIRNIFNLFFFPLAFLYINFFMKLISFTPTVFTYPEM
jgi:hypothetical protein